MTDRKEDDLSQMQAKNRRLDRSQILDVKARSEEAQAVLWRVISAVAAILVGTLLGLIVLWQASVWVMNRFLFTNPVFGIRIIEVTTDGDTPTLTLRRLAGVHVGDNLLALDLARVKRDLELMPWIRAATIERALPQTLRLRVSEREPIAQVQVWRPRRGTAGYEPTTYWLDAEGVVMAAQAGSAPGAQPQAAADDLPLLNGIAAGGLRLGRRMESDFVQGALLMLTAFESSPMFGLVEIQAVEPLGSQALRLLTRQSNAVVFAHGNLEVQFHRWRAVYDAGVRLQRAVATLDLSVTNHSPAVWAELNPQPPPPKARKPTRSRRKHV
jgi:hypothetical protein